MGGGVWPWRIARECKKLVFDQLDEDTVFAMLKKHGMKAKGLAKYVEKSGYAAASDFAKTFCQTTEYCEDDHEEGVPGLTKKKSTSSAGEETKKKTKTKKKSTSSAGEETKKKT